MITIPLDIHTAFNNVKYYDEPHKYFVDGVQLTSVTQLIHKYENDFDSKYWSEYKAEQFNVTPEEVLDAWSFINLKGTMKGSIVHDYAENLFNDKIFPYPKEKILKTFGFDPIWNEYLISKNHVDNFYKDSHNKLIPIKLEYVIYDLRYKIGGMIDCLFYNVKEQEFQIWDYKTNKDFTYDNKRGDMLKGQLSMLKECDHEIYSLQLGAYKKIIEENTSIKIGKSYLIWLSHRNNNYKIIETLDRDYYVDIMFNNNILN